MAGRVQGGGQAEEGGRTDRTQALKHRQKGRTRSTQTFARTDCMQEQTHFLEPSLQEGCFQHL
jgi:hypothetical protein